MSHISFRSETRAFSGPIHGADYNRAAHGNVCITEHCRCGATRTSNLNGAHQEVGEWDMPHARPNVMAGAATVESCRQYLEIVGGAARGREILEDLFGPEGANAIVQFPRRGDEKSTRHIAEIVYARLR